MATTTNLTARNGAPRPSRRIRLALTQHETAQALGIDASTLDDNWETLCSAMAMGHASLTPDELRACLEAIAKRAASAVRGC
jgi:hypothetical protein